MNKNLIAALAAAGAFVVTSSCTSSGSTSTRSQTEENTAKLTPACALFLDAPANEHVTDAEAGKPSCGGGGGKNSCGGGGDGDGDLRYGSDRKPACGGQTSKHSCGPKN